MCSCLALVKMQEDDFDKLWLLCVTALKVLDFVEVLVGRQAGSPLVLSLVEPLLHIIERGMSSDSQQQEQDFLRRAADIFR